MDKITSIFYSAFWTDSGFFLSCWDEHPTIREAAGCVNCAGDYVLATENGVLRALTADEEAEFQRVIQTTWTTPHWVELKEHIEPVLTDAESKEFKRSARVNSSTPCEGETLFEYVDRFLVAYAIGEQILTKEGTKEDDDYSHVTRRPLRVRVHDFVELVLSWLNEWETKELERIYALQVPAWLEALGKRLRRALKHEAPSGR